IPSPFAKNSDVPDLGGRLAKAVLPHHRYACRYWAQHLQATLSKLKAKGKGKPGGSNQEAIDGFQTSLLEAVDKFGKEKLLQWLEVLSLLGWLDVAIPALEATESWLKAYNSTHPMIILMNDGQRFVLQYFEPIRSCASQIYHSGLACIPQCMLYETYKADLYKSVKMIKGRELGWSPCMRVMQGHTSDVQCVAFSHDSRQIVSGSWDNTVCIWDAVTGTLTKRLEGHTSFVQSVAFSHDSRQIVSGSDDKTVCIWDAVTGTLIKRLEGHTDYVRSVAFSHDSRQIVSGSWDETVCIWDAVTGTLIKRLEGYTSYVLSVAFSHDNQYIISSSTTGHTFWWNTNTWDLVFPSSPTHSSQGPSLKSNNKILTQKEQWIYHADLNQQLLYLPVPPAKISCFMQQDLYFALGAHGGDLFILDFSPLFRAYFS
ncbi:hypothetical protein FRC02_004768, partial [Tulasnella sp. 418]